MARCSAAGPVRPGGRCRGAGDRPTGRHGRRRLRHAARRDTISRARRPARRDTDRPWKHRTGRQDGVVRAGVFLARQRCQAGSALLSKLSGQARHLREGRRRRLAPRGRSKGNSRPHQTPSCTARERHRRSEAVPTSHERAMSLIQFRITPTYNAFGNSSSQLARFSDVWGLQRGWLDPYFSYR